MSDDRQRGAGGPARLPGSQPFARTTPGIRGPMTHELAMGTDSTLDMPAATPEPNPDGTLDLPPSDQVAAAGAFDPGQVIGHFVIHSRLGEGGMGLVLAGHDADLGRPVAIKVVKSENDHPAYRARLLREAQAMARIEHPNVVRVYEVGSDRGRLFVAMELVDGVTLSTWLRVQRRTWREVVAIFEQIGAGLAFVHRAGFVHRDFKPDNVLVDRHGRARVADFGLARLDPDGAGGMASPELAASLTRTGMLMGTPGYMAPEQQLGGDVDRRADQYSYCVALREALIAKRQPLKVEESDWGNVPRAIRAVVAKGLSFEAAERFASMDELLVALGRASSRRGKLVGGVLAATIVVAAATAGIIVMATVDDRSSAGPAAPSKSSVSIEPIAPPVVTPIDAAAPARPVPFERVPVTTTTTTILGVGSSAPSKPAPAAAGPGSNAVKLLPPPAFATPGGKPAPPKQPARHEMPVAHREAVRDAIRELGYGGVTITGNDHAESIKELREQLAVATSDLESGMLLYGIGAAERHRGDCVNATVAWVQARTKLMVLTGFPSDAPDADKVRDQAFRHLGRALIGEGMCELVFGRAFDASEKLTKGIKNLFGTTDAERAEVWFAMGIAAWETGDEEHGKQLVLQAGRRGTEKLRHAITAYARRVGLILP